MSIARRRVTLHMPGAGGWGCDGIASWASDPLIDQVYGRDQRDWYCDCRWRERKDEI